MYCVALNMAAVHVISAWSQLESDGNERFAQLWNELNWNASSFSFYSPCNGTELAFQFNSVHSCRFVHSLRFEFHIQCTVCKANVHRTDAFFHCGLNTVSLFHSLLFALKNYFTAKSSVGVQYILWQFRDGFIVVLKCRWHYWIFSSRTLRSWIPNVEKRMYGIRVCVYWQLTNDRSHILDNFKSPYLKRIIRFA